MKRWIVLLAVSTMCMPLARARETCINPPPSFDCTQWHRDDDGRLVTIKALTAGLLGLQKNAYIGDNTMIGGLDYSAALERQCGVRKH